MTQQTGFEFESVTYREGTEMYRFEYDPAATPASLAVVMALSEVLETEPTAFEPFQGSIDTDGLDAVVTGTTDDPAQVTFRRDGYTVTVHSSGVIVVAPADTVADRSVEVSHR